MSLRAWGSVNALPVPATDATLVSAPPVWLTAPVAYSARFGTLAASKLWPIVRDPAVMLIASRLPRRSRAAVVAARSVPRLIAVPGVRGAIAMTPSEDASTVLPPSPTVSALRVIRLAAEAPAKLSEPPLTVRWSATSASVVPVPACTASLTFTVPPPVRLNPPAAVNAPRFWTGLPALPNLAAPADPPVSVKAVTMPSARMSPPDVEVSSTVPPVRLAALSSCSSPADCSSRFGVPPVGDATPARTAPVTSSGPPSTSAKAFAVVNAPSLATVFPAVPNVTDPAFPVSVATFVSAAAWVTAPVANKPSVVAPETASRSSPPVRAMLAAAALMPSRLPRSSRPAVTLAMSAAVRLRPVSLPPAVMFLVTSRGASATVPLDAFTPAVEGESDIASHRR